VNILWFTTRNMVDLCSTTLSALGEGLVSLGHQVTIINSDAEESGSNFPWTHVSIQAQAPRGRKGHVLGREMSRWFDAFEPNLETVAIVDWRIASSLSPILKRKAVPWVLMDRSPPADRGILAKLQWPVWKKAWSLVKNKQAHSGCVVSPSHGRFVHSRVGVLEGNTVEIPAGVDVSFFKPGRRNEVLTLIYHGRLDQNRGVLSLPMFHEKLRQKGVQTKLILIGEGDAFGSLERMAGGRDDIEVLSALPQEELAEKLSQSHIGLLPMPETKVWSLASPLKRSEYAASGLLVFGIDHTGHQLKEKIQPAWIHLVKQENFHLDGVEWLQSLTQEKINSLSEDSREYAIAKLDWSKSVEALEQVCLSCLT
jgi:glycosyltransferase involved in cell wall biosynthesis